MARGSSHTVTVDTNQVVGWQQGRFIFQGQTLEEIATTLGRWYKVSFTFATPGLKTCRMYAHFEQSQSLKQILNAISMVIDLKFSLDDKKHIVTLSGKGC
jgi:ferric-dicitrate binding protein FerR (iron transport regulator)